MAAETSNDLSKVDSLVEEPRKATAEEVKKGHRRASSMAADVYNIADLGERLAASCSNGVKGAGSEGMWG